MQTLEKIRARGDSDFSVNDFDSMPYLLSVVKVCPQPLYLLIRARADATLVAGNLEGLPDRH